LRSGRGDAMIRVQCSTAVSEKSGGQMSKHREIIIESERDTYVQAIDDTGAILRSFGEVLRRDTDLLGPDGRPIIAIRARRPLGFGARRTTGERAAV